MAIDTDPSARARLVRSVGRLAVEVLEAHSVDEALFAASFSDVEAVVAQVDGNTSLLSKLAATPVAECPWVLFSRRGEAWDPRHVFPAASFVSGAFPLVTVTERLADMLSSRFSTAFEIDATDLPD